MVDKKIVKTQLKWYDFSGGEWVKTWESFAVKYHVVLTDACQPRRRQVSSHLDDTAKMKFPSAEMTATRGESE